MQDLKNPAAMWTKALLFLVIGITASVLLLLELASWHGVVLLCLVIWSFCRVYYFAFYVIEKYVDSEYKFSGLFSFLQYLMRKKVKK